MNTCSIHLDIAWVRRDLNTRADFISKLVDFDDWQVTEDVFKGLDGLWGPHTADCFTTYYNRKIAVVGNRELLVACVSLSYSQSSSLYVSSFDAWTES